jgi:hypothetical protein
LSTDPNQKSFNLREYLSYYRKFPWPMLIVIFYPVAGKVHIRAHFERKSDRSSKFGKIYPGDLKKNVISAYDNRAVYCVSNNNSDDILQQAKRYPLVKAW